MSTINISLPEKLKKEAELLIEDGIYVSFSDLTRTALRNLIMERKLEIIAEETKSYEVKKKVPTLKSKKDIDSFTTSLTKK
jgi:Arc/MetJ-type ribon-helix-helix transcriptional regulator